MGDNREEVQKYAEWSKSMKDMWKEVQEYAEWYIKTKMK